MNIRENNKEIDIEEYPNGCVLGKENQFVFIQTLTDVKNIHNSLERMAKILYGYTFSPDEGIVNHIADIGFPKNYKSVLASVFSESDGNSGRSAWITVYHCKDGWFSTETNKKCDCEFTDWVEIS